MGRAALCTMHSNPGKKSLRRYKPFVLWDIPGIFISGVRHTEASADHCIRIQRLPWPCSLGQPRLCQLLNCFLPGQLLCPLSLLLNNDKLQLTSFREHFRTLQPCNTFPPVQITWTNSSSLPFDSQGNHKLVPAVTSHLSPWVIPHSFSQLCF